MLYVMTERWPAARKYRDVFEQIKTSVTDAIVEGNHQATRAVGLIDAEVTRKCRNLDQSLSGGARSDYAKIINDMAIKPSTAPETRSSTLDLKLENFHGHSSSDLGSGISINSHVERIQIPGSANFAFMNDLNDFDDFEGMTTGWDPSMWEGPNAFI